MGRSRGHPARIGASRGAWLALAALWLGCTPDAPTLPTDDLPPAPRTIILISIDTLRADHLGLYGYHRFTSPVLDAFAAEGVVFEDASAPAAWTLPSHASMLTGLFPANHGVLSSDVALSDEVETLAGWFSKAGWDTAAVVNVVWLKRDRYRLTKDFEKYLSIDDSDYRRRSPSTWVTDQAENWIEAQGERPLFLFLHYYDVHADYASLPEYERLLVTPYEGVADGTAWQIERANFAPEHIALCLEDFDPAFCQFGSAEKPRRIDAEMERVSFGAHDVAHLEELYDAGIRQLDTEIGRFLGLLAAKGRSEDTLVVITSDHGEEFSEHGLLSHFLTTYQQSLHVPLMLRGPGVPAGVRVKAPVSLVDLAPTLLALARVPVPQGLDGLDFSSLWNASSSDPFFRRYLYGEASGGLKLEELTPGIYPIFRSVRQGRFKLIERKQGSSTDHFLFDLDKDPAEENDIAELQPERVATLVDELDGRPATLAEVRRGAPVELNEAEIEELRALGYAP